MDIKQFWNDIENKATSLFTKIMTAGYSDEDFENGNFNPYTFDYGDMWHDGYKDLW